MIGLFDLPFLFWCFSAFQNIERFIFMPNDQSTRLNVEFKTIKGDCFFYLSSPLSYAFFLLMVQALCLPSILTQFSLLKNNTP